ncbi:MAG: T9SS type A sorting domain-containing protein [Chitinophagales bacterium]|nr:T9SS type A sorting domain-containing protein [Chitinophagales bacterium]
MALLCLPMFICAALLPQFASAQISGTAFRDFNGNGSQGTTSPNIEPAVAGIIVNAYNSADVLVASYTTGSAGTYSIPSSGSTYNGTQGSNTGSVAAATKVRLEFVIPSGSSDYCNLNESYDYNGLSGATYGSNVRFVSGGATNINFALYYPAQYVSTTNPYLATSIFTAGNVTATGGANNAGTFEDAVKITYNSAAASTVDNPSNTTLANSGSVGSVWGVAYSKQAKKLLYSAALRRHDGLGPNGSGAIYIVDPASTGASLLIDLDNLGFATRGTGTYPYKSGQTGYGGSPGQALTDNIPFNSVIGTNTERGLPGVLPTSFPGSGLPVPYASYDAAALAQVGCVSLGGLDISDDGTAVFVMNLYDKKLYKIAISNPASLTTISSAGAVSSYALPVSISATNGTLRPWGVKYYKGKVYVGVVADASSATKIGGLTTAYYSDLKGYILEFDVASGSYSNTPVATINFNYPKGLPDVNSLSDAGGSVNRRAAARYNKWNNNYEDFLQDNNVENEKLCFPQPIISDFEFDDKGNILVAVLDRMGLQVGYRNYSPSDEAPDDAGLGSSSSNNGRSDLASCDILKVDRTNGPCTITPESIAQAAGSGTEFFNGDIYNTGGTVSGSLKHAESTGGSMALLNGSNRVAVTAYDPAITANCGGVMTLGTSDGDRNDDGTTYYGANIYDETNRGVRSAKSVGLGDIELIGDLAPLEIGNLVWNDANRNGIQDANESGISGVVVQLYASNGTTQLGSATTSSTGNYYFTNANVNMNGASGLTPNTAYVIKISSSQYNGSGSGVLAGLTLTSANVTGNGKTDWSDNDATVVSNLATIDYTTGKSGETNFNIDFGFCPPCSLSVSASHTDANCQGTSTGSVSASVTNASGNVNYLWSNGATTQTVNNLPAGTYTVTVTDGISCTATASTTVGEPPVIGLTPSHSDVSCKNGNNGAASVTVSGGTPSYGYLWNTGATTSSINTLTAGTYTVTVTDSHGCTASTSIIVDQPATSVSVGMSKTNVTITGGNDGTATANPSGGTPGYTYVWSNGQTTQTATGLIAGTYTVTVSDAHNCPATNSIVLSQPPCSLGMSGTQIDVTCHGNADGSIDVSVTGAQGQVTYLWNDGATTQDRTGLSGGTYTVTATDAGGCTASKAFIVNEPVVLGMSGTTQDVTITSGSDGSVDVTVTGGTGPYGYLWNDGATTEDRTNLPAGTYTVTVTDANGCSKGETFTIHEPPCSLGMSGTQIDVTCHGNADGSIDVSVTGAQGQVTYLWNDGATTQDRTGLSGGTYTVTATDAGGCTASKAFIVNEPVVLGMSGTTQDVTITSGSDGSVDVTVTGGTGPYGYLWNDGATTEDRTNLPAGTYTVTVTDANGCSKGETFTIHEPPCSLGMSGTQIDVTCHGNADGSIDVSVTGAQGQVTYLWNDGATTQDRTGLSGGTYTVTATDAGGCTASKAFIVNEPVVLGMSGTTQDVTITSGSDGSVDVTVTGGTGPYGYLWNDGATTEDRTNLPAGTYTVTVTDANGCSKGETFTIHEPPCSLGMSGTQIDVTCHGNADGSIDVSVTGAQGQVTYLWNDGATTQDRTGLSGGTYTVTATDAGGCTASKAFIVGEPVVLDMNGIVNDITIVGSNDGSIDVTVTGGTGPYGYLWNDGATTEDRTNLPAGTYTVTVTDAHGCQVGQSFIIHDIVCDILVNAGPDVSKCHNEPVMLHASSSDQNATYSWSPVTGLDNANIATPTTNVKESTTYTVTVTGAGGCQATDEMTVTVYDLVKAKIVVKPNTPACQAPNVKLFTKNNPNYSYEWRLNGVAIPGAADKNTYCATVSGEYSVHVTDLSTGCMHTSKKVEISVGQKMQDEDKMDVSNVISINAWPNPSSDNLNVSILNVQEGAVTVQLLDMYGRVMSVVNLNGDDLSDNETVTFNMQQLSAGMYFVRLINGDFKTEQKVLLIK